MPLIEGVTLALYQHVCLVSYVVKMLNSLTLTLTPDLLSNPGLVMV